MNFDRGSRKIAFGPSNDEVVLRYGCAISKKGEVFTNQSTVIGLTGHYNWTRASDSQLLSNLNASL